MNWFTDILKTYGPRVVGAAAGVAAAKITEKTGISVDPATLVGVALAAYAAVHKGVSAKVNPGDAATGRVADAIDRAANDPRASNTVTIGEKGI